MDWFLYDRDLRHERIKPLITSRSSPPEVFCKISVLIIFPKFTGKHLRQSLFFNKEFRLLQKTLWHRCFFFAFDTVLRLDCKHMYVLYFLNFKNIFLLLLAEKQNSK